MSYHLEQQPCILQPSLLQGLHLLSSLLPQVISQYLQSTHAPTHKDYTMTLLDVFEVEKEGEKEAFRKDLPNRSAQLEVK